MCNRVVTDCGQAGRVDSRTAKLTELAHHDQKVNELEHDGRQEKLECDVQQLFVVQQLGENDGD